MTANEPETDVIELIDVDCQLGVLPDAPTQIAGPADLAAVQRRLHISGSVLAAVSAWLHDPATGNAETLELAAQVPGARPAVLITPPLRGEPSVLDSPAWRSAVLATAAPAWHGWALHDPALDPIYRAMNRIRRPLRISALQASWSSLERFASTWPGIPLLVGEIGYRTLRELAGVLDRHSSVHVVLSNFSAHQGLEWLVSEFGSGRVLFGSGTPWQELGAAVARLRWSGLDRTDLVAIAHGNARRLLSTPEAVTTR
ncbi:amidohydrolase family protein [Microlunatus sp. Y2014]|uniref:amidohydrolase family protein n=1 Tax=Microlunatus sp. Y2014 TaxID=3418488 RepID=UPI003DA7133D